MVLKICILESPEPLIYRRVGIAHQPHLIVPFKLSWYTGHKQVRSRHSR
ncbi:MAG: hypothetical protein RIM23_04680 [Coleofasciculus sp. G3-WIS-01]